MRGGSTGVILRQGNKPMYPGYQTSTGETAAPGLRANAWLFPYLALRSAGSAAAPNERVPTGTGNVSTTTQGALAFSFSTKTGDTGKHMGSEYPLVTSNLDGLPLTMPDGMSLADAASLHGTFGFGMGPHEEQASIRVGDQTTLYVDGPASVGQTLRAVFPTTAEDFKNLPRAENGCFVPRVEAVSLGDKGENVLSTMGRLASATAKPSGAAGAMDEFRTGVLQAGYVMAARALVSAANPAATSLEEVDRILGTPAFAASESGRALATLAAAFGVSGGSTDGVSRIVDLSFREMCKGSAPAVESSPAMTDAASMALRRVTHAASFLFEYADRHNIGMCLTNAVPPNGERAKVDVLLRTH